MMTIQGRYNTAVCFCEEMDGTARQQIQDMCDQEVFSSARIRIMPDVHAGSGCTIGTTMTIGDRAAPGLVGVDIGCGMETIRLEQRSVDYEALDRAIRERVPVGKRVRETPHPLTEQIDLDALRCRERIDADRARLSLGTLSLEQFRREMEGVFTTCVAQGTLDESPMAYKGIDAILSQIGPTAEVVRRLWPAYNFKAGA